MTVKELCQVDPYAEDIEVVVRENGNSKWIQGYRIGKNAHLFPYDRRIENRAIHSFGFKEADLKAGESADIVSAGGLPTKVIKKSVNNMPEEVANLIVSYFIPRSIPAVYGEALTHIEHSLEIICFPDGWEFKEEKQKSIDVDENGQLIGQMSFEV